MREVGADNDSDTSVLNFEKLSSSPSLVAFVLIPHSIQRQLFQQEEEEILRHIPACAVHPVRDRRAG